jgi:hypothetical protein
VTSYGVALRAREIAVRMALVVRPPEAWRSMLAQGMRPVLLGLRIGVL